MNLETLSPDCYSAEAAIQFLRLQGRRVHETNQNWWYNAYGQNRIYYAFPPHRLVTPTEAEIASVFAAAPSAIAVRYLSPLEGTGRQSFNWVCRAPYDLEIFSSSERNKLRKGLKSCEIRRITFAELNELGKQANDDTLDRLGIESGTLSYGRKMEENPTYECWGAFVENQLAAFLIAQRIEDWFHVQMQRSANEYLKFQSNKALIFSVTRDFLARPGVTTVCYGWEPLYPMESLEKFKLSVGYIKEPVRQRTVFAPRYRWLLNSFTCRVIARAADKLAGNHRWQTFAGVCRYSLPD